MSYTSGCKCDNDFNMETWRIAKAHFTPYVAKSARSNRCFFAIRQHVHKHGKNNISNTASFCKSMRVLQSKDQYYGLIEIHKLLFDLQ